MRCPNPLLKALHKFNPATPEPYDPQKEFPRDRYTRDYVAKGSTFTDIDRAAAPRQRPRNFMTSRKRRRVLKVLVKVVPGQRAPLLQTLVQQARSESVITLGLPKLIGFNVQQRLAQKAVLGHSSSPQWRHLRIGLEPEPGRG
jgi:hypothetical protein